MHALAPPTLFADSNINSIHHPVEDLSLTSAAMDLRGQRFTVDLSDDEDVNERGSESRLPATGGPSIPGAFIGDIKERDSGPATAPKLKTTGSLTGFPEHKKRARVSAFKQQRGASTNKIVAEPFDATTSQSVEATNAHRSAQAMLSFEERERKQIHAENSQRLAAMSAAEIEEERQELMAGLNPKLLERLLRRANLDDNSHPFDIPSDISEKPGTSSLPEISEEDKDAVHAPKPSGQPINVPKSIRFEEDAEPKDPIDLRPISERPASSIPEITHPSMHFPTAAAAPDLDPADPDFLENLHKKYFPSLPADPSKLAWMAPIPTHGSVADQESPYYPGQAGLNTSALRFDFRGGILPPRMARAVPVTKGLHHHGEAPEAAGYTVPELARLARSAFPAQRCMAYQTLGRLLYRLGRGNMGAGDSEIVRGLWKCIEDGKVIETLEEAASAEGGHQGSKTYAIEAVWLWQKGGGKQWKAT